MHAHGNNMAEWIVTRHGTRHTDAQREVYRGEDESAARTKYAATVKKMRQGMVVLFGPPGLTIHAEQCAPRLRSRW